MELLKGKDGAFDLAKDLVHLNLIMGERLHVVTILHSLYICISYTFILLAFLVSRLLSVYHVVCLAKL